MSFISKLKSLVAVALVAISATAAHAEKIGGVEIAKPVEGKDYVVLDVVTPKQKSVQEFVALYCVHCYDFIVKWHTDEAIEKMLAQYYPEAKLDVIHFMQKDVPMFDVLGTALGIIQLKKREDLKIPLFEMTQDLVNIDQRSLTDPEIFKAWLVKNLPATLDEVNGLWNSLKLKNLKKRWLEASQKYKINQTPSYVINGRYLLLLDGLNQYQFDQPLDEIIGDLLSLRIRQLMELP